MIAIIAILAAILFPVFAKAREKARQSSCQSNLKQIGSAIMQYTQDYDETYPLVDSNTVNWRQRLHPYIKSTQVYECPSNTAKSSDASAAGTYDGVPYPTFKRSYKMNRKMQEFGSPHSLSKIEAPAQLIIVGEGTTSDNAHAMAWNDWGNSASPAGDRFRDAGFAGHSGTMNVLFHDTHVKAMKPSRTVDPINMWGRFDVHGSTCNGSDQERVNCTATNADLTANLKKLEDRYN